MINNECMKHSFILLAFIFFMTSSSAFAVPDNIQVGEPTFTVYDASYNIALRNKLEDDFDKKYLVREGNKSIYTSKFGAYYNEVQVPYDLNKKPDDYKIISK